MSSSPIPDIGELLERTSHSGSFSAKILTPTDDLRLEVRGVGELMFPVSPRQAEQLCNVARPARYGKGEETLLDPDVRDTWEIPKSRVKLDLRRFKRTLLPVLEDVQDALGLSEDCELEAEFHSMLVYGPGQFFRPHQDSEKEDGMIGTLVVTLPSAFSGGGLVVEHQGERKTYRGAKKSLSFVAFYADCLHEVRPVKDGYRIVLTYNLIARQGESKTSRPMEGSEAVEALADSLRAYFETPSPPRYEGGKEGGVPNRLVYLLDHQYTQRGIAWKRLKGADAERAKLLAEVGEEKGYVVALVLVETHEVWNCFGPDRNPYSRHRSWGWDQDGGWDLEPGVLPNDPSSHELDGLIHEEIELTQVIEVQGAEAVGPLAPYVRTEETRRSVPNGDLKPFSAEFEGYMGNYGNTLDRWYRRAALVVWPLERTFIVHAEASPAWAIGELRRQLRSVAAARLQRAVASMRPFWNRRVLEDQERKDSLFEDALHVAEGLEDPDLAAFLLAPFMIAGFTAGRSQKILALTRLYGVPWTRALLESWCAETVSFSYSYGKKRASWGESLGRLCGSLIAKDASLGRQLGEQLLEIQWPWLRREMEQALALDSPSLQLQCVRALARPMLGLLDAIEVLGAEDLEEEAGAFLCAVDGSEALLVGLLAILRADASRKSGSPAILEAVRHYCAEQLDVRLTAPPRAEDDWSIEWSGGCGCKLCEELGDFLASPQEGEFEWPLAQAKRQHIHQRIDSSELPVRHVTRRKGSPYTLVLTKLEKLFADAEAERQRWQAALEWLQAR